MTGFRFRRKLYRAALLKDDRGWYIYQGPEIEFKKDLGDGFVLSLSFSRIKGGSFLSDEIHPHLIVYPKHVRKPWSKEGYATGPAGVRTWDALREIWPVAEEKIEKHLVRKNHPATLIITGASITLYRIYSRFLRGRPGYEFGYSEIRRRFVRV